MEYHGRSGHKLLYADSEVGVVVDGINNLVLSIDDREALVASTQWDATEPEPEGPTYELAKAASTELDIKVFSSSDRMYTIPKGVVAEAKRGLKWRKEEGRGGTKVGMSTARTLAKGGQIGLKKVKHIANYFPRHEVDKKGKGYKPSEDGYPSNGRIAWALWGGDAAQSWATAIKEREEKKEKNASITASLYEEFYGDERVDYNSFNSMGSQGDFYARLNLQNGKIDRLYIIMKSGECKVWDDGYWDDMGSVDADFAHYDAQLDDPDDKAEKSYILVDRETAIIISAFLDENPMGATDLRSINPEETELFESAMPEIDFYELDQFNDESVDYLDELSEEEDLMDDEDALVSSGAEFAEEDAQQDQTPGEYTPEERSENASQQVRDKMGRFAETGSRVVLFGRENYQGNITAQNPQAQTVSVELDNGETVEVRGDQTQEISSFEPIAPRSLPQSNLDFSGILGEPRVPIDQPNAQLPGRLPPLTANDVNTLVDDWGSWVADQRLAPEYDGDPVKPIEYKEVPDINTALGKYYDGAFNPDGTPKPGWNPATAENVYNEPLLRDWLDEKYGNKSGVGEGQTYAGGWYRGQNYDGVEIEDKKSRDEVMSPENRARYDQKYDPYNFSITADAGDKAEKLTPETSDVAPMYLAIVADDDPQAVMNLVALVPANKTTIRPSAFIRKPGEWVRDDSIVADLNSPTPPPVVVLDNEKLADVTMQIDGDEASAESAVKASAHFAHTNNEVIRSLLAAGGADRNRGNAENLRRYWTIGKGALKIRWNTPGDWTRCNRYLKKYMGPRAKGYCALRHKEMTGVWPGSKKNVGNNSITASAGVTNTLRSEEEIIEMSTLRARAISAKAKVTGRHGPKPKDHGAKFVIPLVIPEMVETGDGRVFKKDSISMRDLPLPLLWQIKTGNGHDGSVVVGQITHMERVKNGIGNAVGVFDTGEFGQEAERLVRHGFIRGVSADMDKFDAEDEMVPDEAGEDSEETQSGRIKINSARVMAVTIVPKPAFQECYIQIVGEDDYKEETMQPDGVYVDDMNPLDASALVACGMVADAIPMHPPVDWFGDPKLKKATPLTITDDGRVFGHIAAWHVDHIGMNFGTKPPRSRSKYSYFHTGVVKTAEGSDVEVGQLTLAGGHAGLEADAVAAAKHYDDTASAFADVHAGEDAYGIWVAGALRPGTTPDMVRAARASAPSGDWRPIKGSLELVAVCQVNVPGFPIARARVASGQVMALVAAGSSVLAQMKHDPLQELTQKVNALEAVQLEPQREEAKAKFAALQDELKAEYRSKMDELAAKVKDPLKKDREDEEDESWEYMIQMMDGPTETAIVPRRVRRRLAREGVALPDGSFPIRNVSDLRQAVRAYDKAKIGSRGSVAKHIMRRAKALNRPDLIPPRWSTSFKEASSIDEFKDYSEETREEYAKEGKALPDGSFPIANVEDLKRAIKAHGRAKDIAKAKAHIKKRARQLDAKDLIPDEWKSASIDEKSLEMRAVAELAVDYEILEALFSEESLTADAGKINEEITKLSPEEIEALRQEARKEDEDTVPKFTPATQPRDAEGKFRKVLARLKTDLGQSGLDDVIKKIEETENIDFIGNYDRAAESASDLIGIIDRLDAKALNPDALENVRNSAKELGEVMANLPFAFGQENEKIRYSDVPPALKKLMDDMIGRVEEKIGQEDADVATADLKNFMAGGDYYNQSEISAQMSKLLRLLT